MKTERPVAFITGASRGIGRGVALSLARAGYDIAGNFLTAPQGDTTKGIYEVKRSAEEFGAKFIPFPADVSDIDAHDKLISDVVAEFGRIDIFISNAGVAPDKRNELLDVTPESYDRLQNINCRGPFFLSQKVAAQMIKQDNSYFTPKIIYVTSVSAIVSSHNRGEYCVSKAALSMTARLFADALASKGILVYEVRPGIIETDMTGAVKEKYNTLIYKTNLLLQKRWGTPEDIGRAIVSLANDDFPYSTGSVINIDGGLTVDRL